MTSSLVGSEMCIRDRRCCPPGKRRPMLCCGHPRRRGLSAALQSLAHKWLSTSYATGAIEPNTFNMLLGRGAILRPRCTETEDS
eukprot:9604044-Prorocentrum_lima.AAC.1